MQDNVLTDEAQQIPVAICITYGSLEIEIFTSIGLTYMSIERALLAVPIALLLPLLPNPAHAQYHEFVPLPVPYAGQPDPIDLYYQTHIYPATLDKWDWKGVVTQQYPSRQYPVWINLASFNPKPGSVAAIVAYPSLRCSGELILLKQTAHTTILREKITSGICNNYGVVTLHMPNLQIPRVIYTWRKEGLPTSATGTISCCN